MLRERGNTFLSVCTSLHWPVELPAGMPNMNATTQLRWLLASAQLSGNTALNTSRQGASATSGQLVPVSHHPHCKRFLPHPPREDGSPWSSCPQCKKSVGPASQEKDPHKTSHRFRQFAGSLWKSLVERLHHAPCSLLYSSGEVSTWCGAVGDEIPYGAAEQHS